MSKAVAVLSALAFALTLSGCALLKSEIRVAFELPEELTEQEPRPSLDPKTMITEGDFIRSLDERLQWCERGWGRVDTIRETVGGD